MLTTSFILLKVIAIGLGNVLGSDFAGSLGSLIGDVLSEVAKASWERWKIEKDAKARRNELQEIVQSSNVELSQQINEIVHSELANWVPDARKDAEIYLTQMPDSIRGQMRRPDDPSGTTIPANLALKNSKDLLRLLPAKLAHFKPGDRPLDNVDLELVQLLGIGGFGEVWKARNPNLQNASPVALKFCIDPIAILSLRNEARVLDQVMSQGRHVGIVKLLRTYLSAKIPCLEYELIEGGNLSEFIREWHSSEVKPSPIQAAQVILQLAKIMMVAHDAKPPIVHRDLKPANILVCKEQGDTQFKITDFGIGGVAVQQMVRESQQGISNGKLVLSRLHGSYSPLYASPEQMRGDDPDPQDDIFALGVIWYQLLKGDLSIGCPTGQQWIKRLAEDKMWRALIDVLSDCFEETADRLSNASVLVKRLEEALRSRPVSPIKFDWVEIPTGEFLMGSDSTKDKFADKRELPQHKLYLLGYIIARVPVTVEQFEQFVNATGYKTTAEKEGTSRVYTGDRWDWVEGAYWARPYGPQSDVKQKAKHPVTCVSWYDALAFCEWAGVRLPSEAEWERAARGIEGRIYPWSSDAPDQNRCNFNSKAGDTVAVGSYPDGASPEGVLDMAGNVWEWTCSLWGNNKNKQTFRYPYEAGDGREILTAGGDVLRVVRGGAFNKEPRSLRCAFRNKYEPSNRVNNRGFRVAWSPSS